MGMPIQKPGRSKQDYRTPPKFISAVCARLQITSFMLDVAADAENSIAPRHYDIQSNGLEQPWSKSGWNWCNPPFDNINAWVYKAYREALQGAYSAILIPASVGSNWWQSWVQPYAYALFLNGRITFLGCNDPYPKDCALLLYTPMLLTGNQVWTWE